MMHIDLLTDPFVKSRFMISLRFVSLKLHIETIIDITMTRVNVSFTFRNLGVIIKEKMKFYGESLCFWMD